MRIIGHLDMDAFFAAVEERDNPRFAGRPIAVGADPQHGAGRGVVSTANYVAREYGLHSGMPITRAWRLSQAAQRRGQVPVVFLPGDFRKYQRISHSVMDIISETAPTMQQRSVDEAYFDISFAGSFAAAAATCQLLKERIQKEHRLTASVGLGPNKLIAKLASDAHKPDGLVVVELKKLQSFLEPLPVRALPGVGPKTDRRLREVGIHTIGDLQSRAYGELEDMFGKWGRALYHKAWGEDDSPVEEEHEVKSIGKQRTFAVDTHESAVVMGKLLKLAEVIFPLLNSDGFQSFRTVTLTIRFDDFTTVSRSATQRKPMKTLAELKHQALQLILPFFDRRENPGNKAIRLVGLRLEKLA